MVMQFISSLDLHAQANAVSLLRLADAALKEASPRLVIPAENTIIMSSNSEVADKSGPEFSVRMKLSDHRSF